MVKRITKTNSKKSCVARAYDAKAHFKNTYETAKAIKGMLLHKAESYLNQVIDHERCVPFTRYDGATGRTGQAQEFGLTHGRWPVKSVRIVLGLLQNARSNAEVKKLNVDKLVVKQVNVDQGYVGRRRTYRAHGRINAYLSHNCHVAIRCEEREENVKTAPKNEKKSVQSFPKRTIRKQLATAFRKQKFVEVGGKK